jgi:hypothetical protein
MKPIKLLLLIFVFLACRVQLARAQSAEVQQLLLNVEKLSQLKIILSDMEKGYTVLSSGYNSVKNLSQGNFSLHETFLNGLSLVSPEVSKYGRIADIISEQSAIVKEYKSAFAGFRASDNFSAQEIGYLNKVYQQLFSQSIDNLDELANVITSAKLRMSDDERLRAIDRIYTDTQDKMIFLRCFNAETSLLNLQRQKEKADLSGIKKYYNIN